MADLDLQASIEQWRTDPDSTYQTWFLWEERLKNFRSIRRGLEQVVAEMQAGTFGTLYKGSSLETVVKSIAEQRQIFKGADHPFLWKPKLRIPDIYESRENQLAFAQFLFPSNPRLLCTALSVPQPSSVSRPKPWLTDYRRATMVRSRERDRLRRAPCFSFHKNEMPSAWTYTSCISRP